MQNWKTTLAGALTILVTLATAGLAYLHGQPVNFTVIIAGITSGVGLISAKDASTHSTVEQVQASTITADAKAAAAK